MDYKKIYYQIIHNRKNNPLPNEVYSEKHHIIPRSLGGSNRVENIIKLTAREHFICHALLSEMYEKETPEWYKMNNAFMMMKCSSDTQNRYFNSRMYEQKKNDFSKVMSYTQLGKKNSQYGKIWIHNLEEKKSIKIKKNDFHQYEKKNWKLGRIINFSKKTIKKRVKNKKRTLSEKTIEKLKKEHAEKRSYALKLYNKFMESDCTSITEFSKRTDVKYSQGSLSFMWKRWIPDIYKPLARVSYK